MSQNPIDQHSETLNPNNSEHKSAEKKKERKLSRKEDWAAIPYLLLASSGFIVTLIDFVFIQNLSFQINGLFVLGLILLIFGGLMRGLPRRSLVKAGFGNIWATPSLQIVENHQLVTDGYYKHIRHPIYLGELARNFGFALIFSSLYGVLFMVLGTFFLLIRIEIEEKMLVEAFGPDYEKYKKTTKKLIPFLY